MTISLITTTGVDNAIGIGGELIFRHNADRDRFVSLTGKNPVIMGRKTWDSIPVKYKPLNDSRNIILSRNSNLNISGNYDSVYVATSPEQAIRFAEMAQGYDEIFVIGGAEIYRQFIPYTDKLYLTYVWTSFPSADTFFPMEELKAVKDMVVVSCEKFMSCPSFSFIDYNLITKIN